MYSNTEPELIPKQMDETWEMNVHFNPIDEETASILHNHKALLLNQTDDYVQYINHKEKARKQKVKDTIF